MVLHHVAQGAGGVVVAGTTFEADRLGDRDLHVVDVVGVPERLIERVGKPQRHQVLHGFLAEIVIDAEDLFFLEHLADRVVQFECRGQVAADRLLDDDARRFGDQLVIADLFRDVAENARCNGQVEGADAILAVVEQLL